MFPTIYKSFFSLLGCLTLISYGNATPAYTSSTPTIQSKSNYLSRFYITTPGHDSGRIASFFIPTRSGAHYSWVDTGCIIFGSGVGYRYLIDPSLFVGVYGYCDPRGSNIFSNFFNYSSIRVNAGAELGKARIGKATANVHYTALEKKTEELKSTRTRKVIGGVSGHVLFNSYYLSNVDVILCGALTWIKNDKVKLVKNYGLGLKYTIIPNVDVEAKWVVDEYQNMPIQIGMQIRWDGVDTRSAYFNNWLQRAPACYIPSYEYPSPFDQIRDTLGYGDKSNQSITSQNNNREESFSVAEKMSSEIEKGDTSISADNQMPSGSEEDDVSVITVNQIPSESKEDDASIDVTNQMPSESEKNNASGSTANQMSSESEKDGVSGSTANQMSPESEKDGVSGSAANQMQSELVS